MKRVGELPSEVLSKIADDGARWCVYCERAFTTYEIEVDDDAALLAWTQVRAGGNIESAARTCYEREFCPCCGRRLVALSWESVRTRHADYPQEPTPGTRYPY